MLGSGGVKVDRMEMIAILWRTLVLLVGGALLGFASNAWRSDGVPLSSFAAPATCSAPSEGSFAKDGEAVRLVPRAEAALLCGDATTVVADARSARAYAQGHIAGAIHLPCSASEKVAKAAESGFHGKGLLLVYGEGTDDAMQVAEQMRRRVANGLRIGVLEGGFTSWTEAGLACSSGTCPECGADDHEDHTP